MTLTSLGLEQAGVLAEAMREEVIDTLFSSALLRAQMTARPLARRFGLSVEARSGLQEIGAGDLEMCSDADAHDRYLTTVFAWATGALDRRIPGGSDGLDFFRGYDSVIDEIAGRGCATAAVVSHGAAIRTWVAARTSNVDVRFAAANTLANTGIVVLDGSPATGWRVDSWTNAAVPDRTGKADLSRYPTNSVGSF